MDINDALREGAVQLRLQLGVHQFQRAAGGTEIAGGLGNARRNFRARSEVDPRIGSRVVAALRRNGGGHNPTEHPGFRRYVAHRCSLAVQRPGRRVPEHGGRNLPRTEGVLQFLLATENLPCIALAGNEFVYHAVRHGGVGLRIPVERKGILAVGEGEGDEYGTHRAHGGLATQVFPTKVGVVDDILGPPRVHGQAFRTPQVGNAVHLPIHGGVLLGGCHHFRQKAFHLNAAEIQRLVDAVLLLRTRDAVVGGVHEVVAGTTAATQSRNDVFVVGQRDHNLHAGFFAEILSHIRRDVVRPGEHPQFAWVRRGDQGCAEREEKQAEAESFHGSGG